jgi:hypothetical protein
MYLLLNATYMSKKVIRLTESELKRMIKNIISEQPVPGTAPVQGIKKELLTGLRGKNAAIFADAGKTNGLGVYRIVSVGTSTDAKGDNGIYINVTNLNDISGSGNPTGRQADPKGIKTLQISCDAQYLYAMTNGNNSMRVYCPQLEAKLIEALNCPAVNRNVDFSQAGGKGQSDFA